MPRFAPKFKVEDVVEVIKPNDPTLHTQVGTVVKYTNMEYLLDDCKNSNYYVVKLDRGVELLPEANLDLVKRMFKK